MLKVMEVVDELVDFCNDTHNDFNALASAGDLFEEWRVATKEDGANAGPPWELFDDIAALCAGVAAVAGTGPLRLQSLLEVLEGVAIRPRLRGVACRRRGVKTFLIR